MNATITVLTGLGILLLLGVTLRALARSLATTSVAVRCPSSGLTTVVEGVRDADGALTGVVRCAAHPEGGGLPCGARCVAGGGGLGAERAPSDLLRG